MHRYKLIPQSPTVPLLQFSCKGMTGKIKKKKIKSLFFLNPVEDE